MNINIVNDFEQVLSFLKTTMDQLKNFNSITVNDLKLLCYIVYKQNTIEENKEIHPILITALSYINEDTKVYFNVPNELSDIEEVYNGYINNNLKNIFGE